MSDEDSPILWSRRAVLASQLRQAAFLVNDTSEQMSDNERHHNESLFDELAQVGGRLLAIARLIDDGREWSE